MEYDNAKIIWDSKLKNAERMGKQEVLQVQRNAAADKKKLEGKISHLEARISMLEDVINNPEERADEPAAVQQHAPSPLARPTCAAVAAEDDSADIARDLSSLHDSMSPSSSDNAEFIVQLQEENKTLAEAKRSAQLRCKCSSERTCFLMQHVFLPDEN
jgi:hypothetical protein